MSTQAKTRKTSVAIEGGKFLINGQPTWRGREWKVAKIEGMLFNSRMVQVAFDDANPATRDHWKYPDTGKWDPDRNTREFIAAMPEWNRHGLNAFTINFQGGSPQGYSKVQPWRNSTFRPDGSMDDAYLKRLEAILDRADELGMVVMLGYFYKAQAEHFKDAAAMDTAADNATDWILAKKYTHVLVEIANEIDIVTAHGASKPRRTLEFIDRVKKRSEGKVNNPARRLLVSVSYTGGKLPPTEIVPAADYLLLHGNGVGDHRKITQMVEDTRKIAGFRGQPILFNEDDHFGFEKPEETNFVTAVRAVAGWGYFDYRMKGEAFDEGFQSIPANWQISSHRKKGFFALLADITGEGKK